MAYGVFLELPSAGPASARDGHVTRYPGPVADAGPIELASHLPHV
jgi:hypothetical protein